MGVRPGLTAGLAVLLPAQVAAVLVDNADGLRVLPADTAPAAALHGLLQGPDGPPLPGRRLLQLAVLLAQRADVLVPLLQLLANALQLAGHALHLTLAFPQLLQSILQYKYQ